MGLCRSNMADEPTQQAVQIKEVPVDPLHVPPVPLTFETPKELQVYREQCAAGVRQSVAMITAMEHQLFWERSRRQQAEEDAKVLLGAINIERQAAGAEVASLEEAILLYRDRLAEGKLKICADELPKANQAATAIQKHVRGNMARKEYDKHLRDILRGVDPSLDPTVLPASAQRHVSNANNRSVSPDPVRGRSSGGMPYPKHPSPEMAFYQKEVRMIEKRLQNVEGSGDSASEQELNSILKGSYAGGSAQVIAALVRRCKQLQRALVEASDQLDQEQLANEGLRNNNLRVLELSQIQLELNQERDAKVNLQQQLAKMRHLVLAQQMNGSHCEGGAAQYNPYVASFYRKAFAPQEFSDHPPNSLGPNGVRTGNVWMFNGPQAETEFWDDLRMCPPEPVLVPKETVKQYHDLMTLQQDSAASAQRDFVDPLYSAATPDTTFFRYQRDTPLVPMLTTQGLIRESLPSGAFMDMHESLPAHLRPLAGQYHDPVTRQHKDEDTLSSMSGGLMDVPILATDRLEYMQNTPMQPMYSVLPLIREGDMLQMVPNHSKSFRPPVYPQGMQGPITVVPGEASEQLHGQYHEPVPQYPAQAVQHEVQNKVLAPATPDRLAPMQSTGIARQGTLPPGPLLQQEPMAFTPARTPQNFDYEVDTPQMTLFSPSPLPSSGAMRSAGQPGAYSILLSPTKGQPGTGAAPIQATVLPCGPDDFMFRVASPNIDVKTPLSLIRETGGGH